MLAAAAHAVRDEGLGPTGAKLLLARLNALSNGLLDAAKDQPAFSPQKLDAILRDASHPEVPAAVPELPP